MGLALISPDGASAATFYQPAIEAPGDSATQTYTMPAASGVAV